MPAFACTSRGPCSHSDGASYALHLKNHSIMKFAKRPLSGSTARGCRLHGLEGLVAVPSRGPQRHSYAALYVPY
jgi:hypothetical protein